MEIKLEIRTIELFDIESFVEGINNDRISCYKQAIKDEKNKLYGLFENDKIESCFILQEKEGKVAEITEFTIRYFTISELKRDYLEFILNWLKNNNYIEVNLLLDNYELVDPDLEEILGLESYELSSFFHDFSDISKINELTTIKDDFSVIRFDEFSKANSNSIEELTQMTFESLSSDQRKSVVSQFRSKESIKKFIESLIIGEHGKFLQQNSVIAVKGDNPVGIVFITQENENEAVSPLITIAQSHQRTLVLESLIATASTNLIKNGYNHLYLALVALKSTDKDKISLLGFKVVDKVIIYHKRL